MPEKIPSKRSPKPTSVLVAQCLLVLNALIFWWDALTLAWFLIPALALQVRYRYAPLLSGCVLLLLLGYNLEDDLVKQPAFLEGKSAGFIAGAMIYHVLAKGTFVVLIYKLWFSKAVRDYVGPPQDVATAPASEEAHEQHQPR